MNQIKVEQSMSQHPHQIAFNLLKKLAWNLICPHPHPHHAYLRMKDLGL